MKVMIIKSDIEEELELLALFDIHLHFLLLYRLNEAQEFGHEKHEHQHQTRETHDCACSRLMYNMFLYSRVSRQRREGWRERIEREGIEARIWQATSHLFIIQTLTRSLHLLFECILVCAAACPFPLHWRASPAMLRSSGKAPSLAPAPGHIFEVF